jgi:hypothetical protein
MRPLNIFNLHVPSTPNMALGFTQPLTEMSTKNLPEDRERPTRKDDNLTATCDPTDFIIWDHQCLKSYRPPRSVTGIALLLFYMQMTWQIKLNESKSVYIDFTNNKIKQQQPIFINGTKVPYANTAKYLGMTLDAKLRWKEHIKKKT